MPKMISVLRKLRERFSLNRRVSTFPDPGEYEAMSKKMTVLYAEFLLYRLWYYYRNENSLYEFPPVNIRTESNPYYVDALKIDETPMKGEEVETFLETAKCCKIKLRRQGGLSTGFEDVLVFRPNELKRLADELERRRHPGPERRKK